MQVYWIGALESLGVDSIVRHHIFLNNYFEKYLSLKTKFTRVVSSQTVNLLFLKCQSTCNKDTALVGASSQYCVDIYLSTCSNICVTSSSAGGDNSCRFRSFTFRHAGPIATPSATINCPWIPQFVH